MCGKSSDRLAVTKALRKCVQFVVLPCRRLLCSIGWLLVLDIPCSGCGGHKDRAELMLAWIPKLILV